MFNVMAVHVRNKVANAAWGKKNLEDFYDRFVDYVQEHKVRVCIGDFNMAMFQIVESCRSRKMTVDVAAWTAWKTPGGKPRADSMAILFIESPGIYKPSRDPDYLKFDFKIGPGCPLETYLSNKLDVDGKVQNFLARSQGPRPQSRITKRRWRRSRNARGEPSGCSPLFQVKQKELNVDIFNGATGQHRRGAHLPLVAFTHNRCKRSPGATARREQRRVDKKGDGKDKKGDRKGGQKGGTKGCNKGSQNGAAVADKGKKGDQKGAEREQQGGGLAICVDAASASVTEVAARSQCASASNSAGTYYPSMMNRDASEEDRGACSWHTPSLLASGSQQWPAVAGGNPTLSWNGPQWTDGVHIQRMHYRMSRADVWNV